MEGKKIINSINSNHIFWKTFFLLNLSICIHELLPNLLIYCRVLRTQEKRIHFHLYLSMLIQVCSNPYKRFQITLVVLQVSVRLLIYFDQQMVKDVPAKVETEILNSSSFNDSEALTGSSIVCLSNETIPYDNTITESNSFASIGKMVNIKLH